jgi:N-acetylmuramoyl-L-alanine amidase
MKHPFRAGTRALPAATLALALATIAGTGCAVFPRRPPAPPRPAPGYERLRDTLDAVDASGLAGRRIALDPGHGGVFRGALGVGGLTEAEANLGVALRLRDLLAGHGAEVFLTREADRDFLTPADSALRADLAERSRLAAAFMPDLLISIHHNADPRGAHDVNETQTYYRLGDDGPSLEAAQDVHRALVRNVGIRANKVVPGNFYMLRSSAAPALLTETSYITNPDVEERLRLPEKQELEAQAIFIGLARYFARKVPVIEEFVVRDADEREPFAVRGSAGLPELRATVRGAFDDVSLTLDGREVAPVRTGADLAWRAPSPLPAGVHRAALRVGLSGEGSAREKGVDFEVWEPPASISASFPGQDIWDSRGPLGMELLVRDVAGLPFTDSTTMRVQAEGDVAVSPEDTTITVTGGVGWVYFREGRIPLREPSGGRTPKAPPKPRILSVDIVEDPPTILDAEVAPRYRAVIDLALAGRSPLPFRTNFALRMPEGVPLRDAPGTGGPAPALRWINRDGFVRLPRDSSGAVHVPTLPGYRSWPADSAFPPRFVAIAGGALHGRRIVLDPEGGGEDGAGQGPGGTRAASLNLESARILAGFLAAAGAEVRLTREGDLALSEVERVQTSEAFQAERFLRIAHRTAPPRLGHSAASPAGKAWAERSARALAELGLPPPQVTDEAMYVIQQTSCPALLASPASLGNELAEARALAPGALRAEAYALFLALAREWAPEADWPADSLTLLDPAGRPVADAAVTLGGALVLVSDASGRIRFARTEPGSIEVAVQDPRARYRGILLESQRGAVLTGTPGR